MNRYNRFMAPLPASLLAEPHPCYPCGASGLSLDDKQCRNCKGIGRLCVDCYGHLEHDADLNVQQCDECAEYERLDRKACAADDERECRMEAR